MSKKKKTDGLSGFEEVMDIMEPKKAPKNLKGKEGYAVYSFLEDEQRRLEALDEMLSKKYIIMKRYPQTEKLLVKEVYKRNMLKDDLIEKLKYDDSPLNKHLAQVFNSAFK